MVSSHKQGVDIIQTIYNENGCQTGILTSCKIPNLLKKKSSTYNELLLRQELCVLVTWLCPTLCEPARLLYPWNSLGQEYQGG